MIRIQGRNDFFWQIESSWFPWKYQSGKAGFITGPCIQRIQFWFQTRLQFSSFKIFIIIFFFSLSGVIDVLMSWEGNFNLLLQESLYSISFKILYVMLSIGVVSSFAYFIFKEKLLKSLPILIRHYAYMICTSLASVP